MTQCYNIPRGTIDVKPKPITEIAARLRLLLYAMFEAYVSEDGRHVQYGSIHGCEEFKRFAAVSLNETFTSFFFVLLCFSELVVACPLI